MTKNLLLLLLLFPHFGWTQPAGYTLLPVSLTCADAIPVYKLDSTYNSIDTISNSGEFDEIGSIFCSPGSVIDNLQIISFYAGSPHIRLRFEVSNCTTTDQGTGLQIAPFAIDNCQTLIPIGPCTDSGGVTTQIYTMDAYDMTPCAQYYILIDGWNGSGCDYQITIIDGYTAPPPFDLPEINITNSGPLTTGCPVNFSGDNLGNVVALNWTTTGGNLIPYDYDADVIFDEEGEYTICFEESYINTDCQEPVQVCESVTIVAPTNDCTIDSMTSEIISCSQDSFQVALSFDYTIAIDSGFILEINGVEAGIFDYADQPIIIDKLHTDCITPYSFTVIDVNNTCCQNTLYLAPVCCYNCDISNLTLSLDSIIENDLVVTLDFNTDLPNEFLFELYQNEDTTTHNIGDLPYTFNMPCSENIEYGFSIPLFDDCVLRDTLQAFCGDSLYQNLSYSITSIDDNSIEVFISYDLTNNLLVNPTATGCLTDIFINGTFFMTNVDDEDVVNLSLGEYDCHNVSDLEVTLVNSCQPYQTYSIFIPESDLSCTVGVQDIYNQGIIIFKDQNQHVFIQNKLVNVSIKNVKVVGMDGKLMKEKSMINQTNMDFSMHGYASGVYLIYFELSNGETYSKKMVL